MHNQKEPPKKRRREDLDFVTISVRDDCAHGARDITFRNRHDLEMDIGEELGNLQWLHGAVQAAAAGQTAAQTARRTAMRAKLHVGVAVCD